MIDHALRRAQNVHWQSAVVTREAHAGNRASPPRSCGSRSVGSGKSTIANMVEQKLHTMGRHSFLLDGDNIRHGLNRDLDFSEAGRVENIRRVGEVAKLMADAGLIVLTAFISPFKAERDMVRALLPQGEFVEIFIDTPLDVAEDRDVKGLYAKARAGEIAEFTASPAPMRHPSAPRSVSTRPRRRGTGRFPDRRACAGCVELRSVTDAELARSVAVEAGELLKSIRASSGLEGKALGAWATGTRIR